MAHGLPPEKMGAALASITQWRIDPDKPVACPVCSAQGLQIIDQSARPFAEWYALRCTFCELEATLHIPLAPPV